MFNSSGCYIAMCTIFNKKLYRLHLMKRRESNPRRRAGARGVVRVPGNLAIVLDRAPRKNVYFLRYCNKRN